MKRILFFLLLSVATFFITNVSAASNPASDYTYIDCNTGSDVTGTPFDSDKPYLSLKKWVESTIAYINSNWLSSNTGSGLAYSWATFNIYVQAGCIYNNIHSNVIYPNFISLNNSKLKITWKDGKFFIDNVFFYFSSAWAGNVIFDNIYFNKNDITPYYFYTPNNTWNRPVIIIQNSIIKLHPWTQTFLYNWNGSQLNYYIKNSVINLNINWNVTLDLPILVKDNKINIYNVNQNSTKYNIVFSNYGKNISGYNYASLNMISNEINMWGNHFKTHNGNDRTFINNKFINVWTFIAWDNETSGKTNHFINNEIHAQNQVNLSNNYFAFNNYIPNGFIDTNNTDNYKRNFSSLSGNELWIWWILNRQIHETLKIYIDYRSLYQEVTGNNLPNISNPTIFTIHY